MLNHSKSSHSTGFFTKIKQSVHRADGGSIEFDLSKYRDTLQSIKSHDLGALKDGELRGRIEDCRLRLAQGATSDDMLPQVYAVVIEAIRRRLGIEPFDVQILAAIAMHEGKLAEMNTGEGKTLAAVFPAVLNALSGEGVHVLTANDYLARRDAEWMGPVYRLLGLEARAVGEGMKPDRRRSAYSADITYLTANEAGFDFLRDQVCLGAQDLVHRPFHFAIVDEADFILIDEARVPLVIAGEAEGTEIDHVQLARLVRSLKAELHYTVDENDRNVNMTEGGLERAEAVLGCGDLYQTGNEILLASLNVALHAEVLLHRDIDYIVRGGKVELVDAFTGRVADNRRWPHGIHQAVEAKEGVPLEKEGRILGSITMQHLLRLYPKISGMTATAQPAAEEFKEFYNLNVVVIPPNRTCRRIDEPDRVFAKKEYKMRALTNEISRVHATGRPVLVGTGSVEESELLAGLLKGNGILCRVLNAKNDEAEAAIIAEAGGLGAVTISTNMAGRGTDIRLGGEREEERDEVVRLGGLYVIGTNRHESRRIDDQLRGRAGRQGDPGSSRFFISLEDDLMVRYHLDELIPPRYRPSDNQPEVEHPVVLREIDRAQRIIEGQNFEIRKTLWGYSEVIERQRKLMGLERRRLLTEEASPGVWASGGTDAQRYRILCSEVGAGEMERLERRAFLRFLDHHWAQHLAVTADIKEGIHLVRLGGRTPLPEFQQEITKEFATIWDKIERDMQAALQGITVKNGELDLSGDGFGGSSATWTYLINDNPFGNLGISLMASRNIGLAAYAGILPVLYWPVTLGVLVWRLIKKWKQR
jgi:preprotein translocase subunit SecA